MCSSRPSINHPATEALERVTKSESDRLEALERRNGHLCYSNSLVSLHALYFKSINCDEGNLCGNVSDEEDTFEFPSIEWSCPSVPETNDETKNRSEKHKKRIHKASLRKHKQTLPRSLSTVLSGLSGLASEASSSSFRGPSLTVPVMDTETRTSGIVLPPLHEKFDMIECTVESRADLPLPVSSNQLREKAASYPIVKTRESICTAMKQKGSPKVSGQSRLRRDSL